MKEFKNNKVYPQTTRIFETDDDTDPTRIPFDFERFTEVKQTLQQASDHCPVSIEIPH